MKTKVGTFSVVVVLSAVLAVCGWAGDSTVKPDESAPGVPSYPRTDFSKAEIWDVVRVVACDTVIIGRGQKQLTIRLVGVAGPDGNSAEISRSSYQSQAVEYLSNLLAGEQVFVAAEQETTVVGESLASGRLFRCPDGLYVNLEMVRLGYSQMVAAGLGAELKLFRTYQERARSCGKGLWGKHSAAQPSEGSDVIVYVTKAGKRYHRGECRFLAKSKIPLGLAQAKERGYTACLVCKPDN